MIGWKIYWALEPPLADRLELAIGILASLLANVNRDSKRHPQAFAPRDFMVDWQKLLRDEPEPKHEGMTPEQILSAFDLLIERQQESGTVVRKDH